ncbi:OLC1v1019446C1 [Oldenlandia corymbosa var. corymbosa]|uniref:OLC1v1019446C1 n=1 Tax=Oldenlandia corymbosa var. corymbosa TaxID=529605 RepID=A0AAV1EE58_OLDCO|nr:OLC1v1019446C1 [Oldenlandia corymbosa var. corymbosa]
MMLCIPKYKGVDDTIFIIAGWQPEEGPHVYVIDSKGSRLFEQFKNFGPNGFKHLLGSGAMRQVNHYLDQGYRYEMSLQEALDLAESVICFASTLDRGTGGLVHVRYLSRNTLRRQSPRDIANLVENKYKEVFQQFLNGGYSSMEE